MATAAARQRRSPPGEAEGEPEAKKMRSLQPPDFAGGRRGVVLNPADCDLDFTVDGDGLRGHALHEDGFAYCWSGARAAIGITAGKYCFGCRILSDQEVQMDDTPADQRHLCRIGVSQRDDPVGSFGETVGGGGFGGTGKFSIAGRFSDYGEKFGAGDTVVCAVDLESSSSAAVGFLLNGRWLGTAWRFDAGELRGSGLFPHVLLKNVAVDMQFSVEDGLVLEEGFKPWSSAVEDGNAIAGPSFLPAGNCEVVMMVGLPAAGKTTWAEKWAEDHPEKRYLLLGTNLALDQMKVPGLLRKKNYGERFERLMEMATGIFNTLLGRAARTPRNYIIDQTNVYRSARKRKLRPFVDFRKIAVVVFPAMDELRWRSEKRVREMGKEVPAEAVNEMIANFVLPVRRNTPHADEPFDQVMFPELDRREAERVLEEMKRTVRSAANPSERSSFPLVRAAAAAAAAAPGSSAASGGHPSYHPQASIQWKSPDLVYAGGGVGGVGGGGAYSHWGAPAPGPPFPGGAPAGGRPSYYYSMGRSAGGELGNLRTPPLAGDPLFFRRGGPLPAAYGVAPVAGPPPPGRSFPPPEGWRGGGYPSPGPWNR